MFEPARVRVYLRSSGNTLVLPCFDSCNDTAADRSLTVTSANFEVLMLRITAVFCFRKTPWVSTSVPGMLFIVSIVACYLSGTIDHPYGWTLSARARCTQAQAIPGTGGTTLFHAQSPFLISNFIFLREENEFLPSALYALTGTHVPPYLDIQG